MTPSLQLGIAVDDTLILKQGNPKMGRWKVVLVAVKFLRRPG
jgi:hypothetical protein